MMAGVSLKDACELIGIGDRTWRDFEQKNPDFRRKRKQWQGMLKARAKVNIAEQVFGNKEKGIELLTNTDIFSIYFSFPYCYC